MQSYRVLSPTAVESATQRLKDVAAGLGDGATNEAERLALRLAPWLWPLEWHLPFWLGCDLGLQEAVWQQLVVVNLLGMAHVRLTDDLADEEMDQAQQASKTLLGQRLLDTSTELLLALFQRESRFWHRYAAYIDQWQQAGQGEESWRGGAPDRLKDDWQWLAWRGAAVKITATGVCLLAQRDALIDPLESCVDHTMAATVLLDHADDWPEDLPACRFNAYVAWLSDLPQDALNADRNRQQVLSALMQGDGARHQAYSQLIDDHLEAAQSLASRVGSAGLSAYIGAFRQNAREQGIRQLEDARQTFQDALASLLAGFDDC